MKIRNLKVSKMIGTRAITGILVASFLFCAPMTAYADEYSDAGETKDIAEEVVRPTAKQVDGTQIIVDVSDEVWNMIESGEIWYDETTGYLKDSTNNQYVDPTTGVRVATIPTADNKEKKDTDNKQDSTSTEKDKKSDAAQDVSDQTESTESTEDASSENQETQESSSENQSEEVVENTESDESSGEEAEATEETGSNEELIAKQNIVAAPEIYEDFRFWTISKKYSFAKKAGTSILEEIPSEKAGQTESDVRVVGTLAKKAVAYVIKEVNDDWLYVESGDSRGFVKKSEMYTGQDAKKILTSYEKKAKKAAKKAKKTYSGIDNVVKVAKTKITPSDNQAYTYLRATTNQVVISKDYALVNNQVTKDTGSNLMNIYESTEANARVVGTLKTGGLCYIIADKQKDWVYIESGDVRGFVKKEYLTMDNDAKTKVTADGEESFSTAMEVVKPKENKALYYSQSSIKEGSKGSAVRNAVLEFASQFVGNPYVWGGTSLTEGADCSGFVQQIYLNFGYTLPRVAEDQAQYGMQIPVEDAAPGDLIFYAENGYIYHVVMYAGNGTTIEAANEDVGIIYGHVDYTDAVWATRILDDDDTSSENLLTGTNSNTSIFGL